MSEMRARFGLDTAGVSAALSRVGKAAKGTVDQLGQAVPILGTMTSKVGIIALGIGSLFTITKAWVAEIEKGNRALATSSKTAREVTGRAGLAGMAGQLQAAVDTTAGEGVLNQSELFSAAGQFMNFAPTANIGQAQSAVRGAQKAGTAGLDANNVMAIAGVLIDNSGMPVADAIDMAAMLSSALGADAAKAPETLQRLLQSLSVDDAVQALMSLRGKGRGIRGRALSALEAMPAGTSVMGAQRSLARAGVQIDFSETVDSQGFLDNFLGQQLRDPNQMLDAQIAAQQNLTAVRQQATADRDMELRREQLRTDDVGRLDPIGLLGGLRNVQSAAGMGGTDQAGQGLYDAVNTLINRNRSLGTDDN